MEDSIKTDEAEKLGAMTRIIWFSTRTVGGVFWTL